MQQGSGGGKIPSCCEGHSLRGWYKFSPQTDLRPVFSLLHLWLLWISLSVLNLIVRTEPRSVPRGNFCAVSDRKWEDEQCYSTWRWVHAVPPRAEQEGKRIIQCGEEARPNKTCLQYYRKWAGPHRICFKGTFWADFRKKSVGFYGMISLSWEYYFLSDSWKYHQIYQNI